VSGTINEKVQARLKKETFRKIRKDFRIFRFIRNDGILENMAHGLVSAATE